jgi:hypothetical protein
MVGSGSGIRDKQTKFVNSLYTKIGRIQNPGSGAFLPPGSGIRIRDGAMVGSGIKHPGSATLVQIEHCTETDLVRLDSQGCQLVDSQGL